MQFPNVTAGGVCVCVCIYIYKVCQGMAAVQHRRLHPKAYYMTAVKLKDMIQQTPLFTTGLEISNEALSRSLSQTTAQPTCMCGLASQLHNKINHLHMELLQ